MMIVIAVVLFLLFVGSLLAAVHFRTECRVKDAKILDLGEEIETKRIQALGLEHKLGRKIDKRNKRIHDLEEEVSKKDAYLAHFLLQYLDQDGTREHLDNVRDIFGSKSKIPILSMPDVIL